MANDCAGILGYLFGHRFEGRYSTFKQRKPRDGFGSFESPQYSSFRNLTPEQVTEHLKSQNDLDRATYHGDICTRCGITLWHNAEHAEDTEAEPEEQTP